MKKIKFLVGAIVIVLALVIFYLMAAVKNLSREEVFYGEVSHPNQAIQLYSKDDEYKIDDKKLSKSFNKGDIIKVIFTDNKGVILEMKKVSHKEVPKDIQKKLKMKA